MKLRTASESVGWLNSEGPLTVAPSPLRHVRAIVAGDDQTEHGIRDVCMAMDDFKRAIDATTDRHRLAQLRERLNHLVTIVIRMEQYAQEKEGR